MLRYLCALGVHAPRMRALPEGTRILEADAERTFKNPLLRTDMVKLLAQVCQYLYFCTSTASKLSTCGWVLAQVADGDY